MELNSTGILASMGPTLQYEGEIRKAIALGVESFRIHLGLKEIIVNISLMSEQRSINLC